VVCHFVRKMLIAKQGHSVEEKVNYWYALIIAGYPLARIW
jgi:hypothetical protein